MSFSFFAHQLAGPVRGRRLPSRSAPLGCFAHQLAGAASCLGAVKPASPSRLPASRVSVVPRSSVCLCLSLVSLSVCLSVSGVSACLSLVTLSVFL